MGDACASELIRRRLLPDVCNCCVCRNASLDLPFTFSLSFLGRFRVTEDAKYRNARQSHLIYIVKFIL